MPPTQAPARTLQLGGNVVSGGGKLRGLEKYWGWAQMLTVMGENALHSSNFKENVSNYVNMDYCSCPKHTGVFRKNSVLGGFLLIRHKDEQCGFQSTVWETSRAPTMMSCVTDPHSGRTGF